MKKIAILTTVLLTSLFSKGQIQLITNGDFSGVNNSWTIGGQYWWISSLFSCNNTNSAPAYAYTGNSNGSYANNMYGSMYQQITIPSSAISATLSYKISINTYETTTTVVEDVFEAQLRSTNMSLLYTFNQLSNLNGGTLPGCQIYQTYTFSVPSTYFGQTLLLNFQTASGSSNATIFRLDDVSLTYVTYCTTPTTPTLNVPNVISSSQIDLNWNNVGANSYDIYYTYGNCPWNSGNFYTNTSSTSVSVTGLNPNTTYLFNVISKNSSTCTSGNSNCQSATTQQTNPISYLISGNVTNNSNPLNGVTITAMPGNYLATTNSFGNYSISLPAGWTGTISSSLTNYTLTPLNYSYSNLSANLNSQNFSASAILPPSLVTFKNHNNRFSDTLLWTSSINQPAPNPALKICADGSRATRITYINSNTNIPTGNIKFWIHSDPYGNDAEQTGYFVDYNIIGNKITAVYQHPLFLNSNTLKYKNDIIDIVDFTNGTPFYQIPFRIYRAPVLFVHGWLGGLNSFEEMNNVFYQQYYISTLTHRLNYAPTSTESFYQNRNEVPNGILELSKKLRKYDYSFGKVDIVAHSMGGILSRLYLQSNNYKQDINKLITLNTPHSGSQGANFLHSIGNVTCPLITWVTYQNYVCSPALENMKVNSYEIRQQLNGSTLNQNVVPSFAISTEDFLATDPDCSSLGNILYSGAYGALDYLLIQSIFNFEGNDLVVPKSSQRGGLSKTHNFLNQCHLSSSKNSAIIDYVLGLLNSSPTGTNFDIDGFNPPVLNSLYLKPVSSNNTIIGNLTITNPINGSYHNVGDQIQIQTNGSTNIKKTVIAAGNEFLPIFATDTLAASTSTSYIIPQNAFDKIRIICAGYDTLSGSLIGLDTVIIKINNLATLDSISVYSEKLEIPLGSQVPLSIIGYFNDNLQRDISLNDSLGFSIVDTPIANHVYKNIFHGNSIGKTLMNISYRNQNIQIPIEVYKGENIQSTILSADKTSICLGHTINFSDVSLGNVLSRNWIFPGGTPSSSNNENPEITYNTIGNYTVTLITNFSDKTDTLILNNLIKVGEQNKTINSGNWNAPSTWACETIPTINDSAVIASGHIVLLDTIAQLRKLYIENNGSLLLNDSTKTLTLGNNTSKTSQFSCNGYLNITNGNLKINGSLNLKSGGSFNMTGGKIIIDGNNFQDSTSITDGQHLFNISPSANNFSFTGGTLQFINPPHGLNSQTLNCRYNFGPSSTVIFGDGLSTTPSNNPNGFGSNLLPARIGKLVLDAVANGNNREFKTVSPLTITKDCKVLSGNLVQIEPLNVIDSLSQNSITDYDGNVYPVLKICNQIWTEKNLEVTHYRNGDTIPQVQDSIIWASLTTGAWRYYLNNTATGAVYGKLYNWYAINDSRGIAPIGWHIPTNAEWATLTDNCLSDPSIAGGKMKTKGIAQDGTGLWQISNNTSTNSSGFSAIPAGYCIANGTYINLGIAAFWWSITPYDANTAWLKEVDISSDYIYGIHNDKKIGASVRCIKN